MKRVFLAVHSAVVATVPGARNRQTLAGFRHACFAATIALVAALLVPVGASAATLTTLVGQTFGPTPPDHISISTATQNCNATGLSTFSFTAQNNVGPPYYWQEKGTFTLDLPSGTLTAFQATFTVQELPENIVIGGTVALVAPGSGGCTPQPNGLLAEVHLVAGTSYSTTAPFVETGFASTTLDWNPFATTGTFTQGPFTLVAPGNTPLGSPTVSPLDAGTGTAPVTLAFTGVTVAGDTSLTISSSGPPAPTGFSLGTPPKYFNIATTAVYSQVVVCITDPSVTAASRLFHYDATGVPTDVTASVAGTTICSIPLTSLSPFAIAVPVAVALTTLVGQTFITPPDFFSLRGVNTCNAGPSTFSFHASNFPYGGNPSGPFWDETGTFTLDSPNGPLSAFQATFTVKQTGQADIVGTISLATPGSGGCAIPGGNVNDLHFAAETSYITTGLFVEAGFASTTVDAANLNSGGTGTMWQGPFTLVAVAPGNTGIGAPVTVSLSPYVTVTFASVTQAGDTTLRTSGTGPPLPPGYAISGFYYYVSTTALFIGAVVCITSPSDIGPVYGPNVALLHYNPNPPSGWADVTDYVNYPVPHSGTTICSTPLNSLSPFVIASPVIVAVPPVAIPHFYSTPVNVALTVPAPGLLIGDPAGVFIAAISPPANGILSFPLGGTLGDFTYTPNPGFIGIDTFTYTIMDSAGLTSAPATVTITVGGAKADQTISFGLLGSKTFGDAPFGVSATASSGLAVTFGASGACTVAGSTVTITGAGSCTITASQAGNANFNSAPDVPQSFSIAKENQTISFGLLGSKTFGDAPFGVSATASSGLAVTFGASGACTVAGSTVTITGAGSCTITASQAGNANFNSAPDVPQSFSIAVAGTTVTEHVIGLETGFPTTCSGGSLSSFFGIASGPLIGFWSAAICHTTLDKSATILGGTFVLNSKTATVRGSFTGGSVVLVSEFDSFGLCIQTFRVSGTLTDGTFNAVLTHYGVRTASGCRVFFATINGTATLTF